MPTRKLLRYESPEETELSCMFSLSVGVYQRKLGGLAELASAMNVEVVTPLPVNIVFPHVPESAQALGSVFEYARNGKWSEPLGQPSAQ